MKVEFERTYTLPGLLSSLSNKLRELKQEKGLGVLVYGEHFIQLVTKCGFSATDKRTITDCEQGMDSRLRMLLASYRSTQPAQSSFMFLDLTSLITQAGILETTMKSAPTREEQEIIKK